MTGSSPSPAEPALYARPDDRELLWRFERHAIHRSEWTHELHLRIACIYLRDLDAAAALAAIRRGILALNAANGIESSTTASDIRGYHETITAAWIRMLASRRRGIRAARSSDEFLASNTDLLDKRLLEKHYSPELLCTERARTTAVEPDREPLPPVSA